MEYAHKFVDFSNVSLTFNGKQVHTCPPAMGFSFAAGTIDGPGAFNFTQGRHVCACVCECLTPPHLTP